MLPLTPNMGKKAQQYYVTSKQMTCIVCIVLICKQLQASKALDDTLERRVCIVSSQHRPSSTKESYLRKKFTSTNVFQKAANLNGKILLSYLECAIKKVQQLLILTPYSSIPLSAAGHLWYPSWRPRQAGADLLQVCH